MKIKYLIFLISLILLSSCAFPNGSNLFVKEKCISCHKFKGVGGSIGPDLTEVTKRRTDDWIRQQIKDSTVNNPSYNMPGFGHLSEREINALIEYLKSGPPPKL